MDLSNLSIGWAFIGAVLCINALTSILKRPVRWLKPSDDVYDAVIDLIPIVLGAAIAFIPEMTVEGIESFWARLVFFIGIGGTASSWYAILKALINAFLKKVGAKPLPASEPPTKE